MVASRDVSTLASTSDFKTPTEMLKLAPRVSEEDSGKYNEPGLVRIIVIGTTQV